MALQLAIWVHQARQASIEPLCSGWLLSGLGPSEEPATGSDQQPSAGHHAIADVALAQHANVKVITQVSLHRVWNHIDLSAARQPLLPLNPSA